VLPTKSLAWAGLVGLVGRPNTQYSVDCGQIGIARSPRAPDHILSSSPTRLFVFLIWKVLIPRPVGSTGEVEIARLRAHATGSDWMAPTNGVLRQTAEEDLLIHEKEKD
jgi:hypothetical protein